MSENTLVQKIQADADAAVAEVRAEQAAAIEKINAETEAAVAELRSEHEKQLEKKLAHVELVALSRAKQSANIAVQAAKRASIDEVFTAVQAEIIALDSEAYVKFFSAQAEKIVPSEVEVTSVVAPDNRVDDTKAVLKAAKLSGDIVADKSVAAGFIVYTKDGVYDVTLSRLFADNQASMEMDVVAALN